MKTLITHYQRTVTKITLAALSALPSLALAGPISAPNEITSIDELKENVFCRGADWLFTFAIIFSVLFVLYASFLYVTSAGDEKKLEQAKKTITYAAVGVAVAVLATGLPYVVGGLLGVDSIGSPCQG